MKSSKLTLILAGTALILNSCDESSGNLHYSEAIDESAHYEKTALESDDTEKSILSSTSATYTDDNRRFIRRADVELEVHDVYESTIKIESKISELGGFVEQSKLNSFINQTSIFPISSDSAVEVRKYKVSNQMTLRLPHNQLNTFLISLGDEVQFLNHRKISADDVHLDLLSNQMEKERLSESNKEMELLKDANGKTSEKQEVIAEISKNNLIINQEALDTLKTMDDIEFSTITLFLSEKEKIAQTTVINPNSYTDKFRPSFFSGVWTSIKGGFYLLQSLLLALLYIWPIIILAVLGLAFFRQHKNRKTV